VIRFRAPVRRDGEGFVVALSDDEAELVRRLLAELGELLIGDERGELTARLFPVVHPDDPDQEAEYQRWMRPELVESKLTAIGTVDRALAGDGRLDESGMVAFMQAVNSVRLVLGTMLGLTDDDQPDEDDADSPYEMQLYVYLSWLLEWSVRALSA
jgi:hypothetical protein